MKKGLIFSCGLLISLMFMFPIASAFSFSELLPKTGNVVVEINDVCVNNCLNSQCSGKFLKVFCMNRNKEFCQQGCVEEEVNSINGEVNENVEIYSRNSIDIATKAELRNLNQDEIAAVITEDILEKANDYYIDARRGEGYAPAYGWDLDDLLFTEHDLFQGDIDHLKDGIKDALGDSLAGAFEDFGLGGIILIVATVGLIGFSAYKGDAGGTWPPDEVDDPGPLDPNGSPGDSDEEEDPPESGEDICHYCGTAIINENLKDYLEGLDYIVDINGDVYVSEPENNFFTKIDKVQMLENFNSATPSF